MGVYLPKPHTEKFSDDGGKHSETLTCYGLSSMQGWRQSMEDAHISIVNLQADSSPHSFSVYGVFDGHGGAAVSLWVAKKFEQVFCKKLKETKERFQKEESNTERNLLDTHVVEVCETLQETFLALDKLMDTTIEREELRKIYEKAEKTRQAAVGTSGNSGDSKAGESLLDSWLMDMSNQRQYMQVLDKNDVSSEESLDSDASHRTENKDEICRDIHNSVKKTLTSVHTSSTEESSGLVESHTHSLEKETSVSLEKQASPHQSNDGPPSTIQEGGCLLNKECLERVECKQSEFYSNAVVASQNNMSSCLEKPSLNMTFNNVTKSGETESDVFFSDTQYNDDMGGHTIDYRSQPYQPESCGCTAVVVVVFLSEKNPVLITANAGDSRAVLCRNGSAIALSDDHKPCLPREAKRIHNAGGTVSFGRVEGNLNLSRALGDLCYKCDPTLLPEEQKISGFPDVSVVHLCPEDQFVILACDGIWDCLTNQEAVNFVLDRLPSNIDDTKLSEICEKICDTCLSQNPLDSGNGVGCDNMTVIIVMLSHGLVSKGSATTSTRQDKCVIHYGVSSPYEREDSNVNGDISNPLCQEEQKRHSSYPTSSLEDKTSVKT